MNEQAEFSPVIEEVIQKYETKYPKLREVIRSFLAQKGRDWLWETELITCMYEAQGT
jgi:hypothetical protein